MLLGLDLAYGRRVLRMIKFDLGYTLLDIHDLDM
jgi:hypothetical protein